MSDARSMRIDPFAIQGAVAKRAPRASVTGSTFGDIMSVAGAFAPLAGEVGYQTSGSANAAAVLHSAFSALPDAAGVSSGGMGLGELPGMYGPARSTGAFPGDPALGGGSYGNGYSGGTGQLTAADQSELMNQMNQNNLQLLGLQANMQNNMQGWTTKSNVLKSVHDAKMAMIQHFAVRG